MAGSCSTCFRDLNTWRKSDRTNTRKLSRIPYSMADVTNIERDNLSKLGKLILLNLARGSLLHYGLES